MFVLNFSRVFELFLSREIQVFLKCIYVPQMKIVVSQEKFLFFFSERERVVNVGGNFQRTFDST